MVTKRKYWWSSQKIETHGDPVKLTWLLNKSLNLVLFDLDPVRDQSLKDGGNRLPSWKNYFYSFLLNVPEGKQNRWMRAMRVWPGHFKRCHDLDLSRRHRVNTWLLPLPMKEISGSISDIWLVRTALESAGFDAFIYRNSGLERLFQNTINFFLVFLKVMFRNTSKIVLEHFWNMF